MAVMLLVPSPALGVPELAITSGRCVAVIEGATACSVMVGEAAGFSTASARQARLLPAPVGNSTTAIPTVVGEASMEPFVVGGDAATKLLV
ncbi:hypothetical protein E2562_006403 [Oryza meyeriana var. granulata]|uniref:Uncharacterized protein n=1 Tax=Oryza meyeriana var. granulata TaxID=110450 RepID=A0A6G1EFI5_9ORYZ|nr:hypothetical protein E2562_006403 [Oryza meyeriana var. granulata]